jgi:purine-binding chemotaxis protein CheW
MYEIRYSIFGFLKGGFVMSEENRLVETEEDDEEIEKDQYLIFTVKGQEFGIQAMRVQEITSPLETREVPNAPSYIEGIVNLRGRLVSVLNFRNKFRFPAKEHDEETRIVIVEHEGFPIGIIVDGVEEVIKIPEDKVHKLPEASSSPESDEFITGIGMLDERLMVLLDVDKLLKKTKSLDGELIEKAIDEAKKNGTDLETKGITEASNG